MSNKKVPDIRFKGFEDTWEQRKVGDIFKVTRGYVLAATETDAESSQEKLYPVYSSQTKDNGLMGYYSDCLYEDAITWTTDGANAGTVNYRAGKFYCTNVCGVLLSDKVKATKAISEAINLVAKKYVSYVGNPKLMNNVMSDIDITIPSSEEESDAIAAYFMKLEELITLHQKKLEKLENMKKTMLNLMFPNHRQTNPVLRFNRFVDDWEQRKLESVATFSKGSGYSKGDLKENGTPIILYGRLYTKYETIISDVDTFVSEKRGSVYSKGGEVIIPASGETAEDIARAATVENKGVLLGGDLNVATPNEDVDPAFLALSISHGAAHKELASKAQGKSVVHIHNAEIQALNIAFPSRVEQSKISIYFAKMDKLITLHQYAYYFGI